MRKCLGINLEILRYDYEDIRGHMLIENTEKAYLPLEYAQANRLTGNKDELSI